MRLRKLMILPVAIIAVGALIYFGRPQGTAPTVDATGKLVAAPPSAEHPTDISYLEEHRTADATARIDALRSSHRKVEQNLSATLTLSESESQQFVDVHRARTAAVEQELIDSLTSLTQQLVNEPGSTTSAIALLSAEEDPQMMTLIAQALGEAAAALGSAFPYDLLMNIALNDDNLQRRQAALVALAYMRDIPPDLQQKLAEMAQSAPTAQLRAGAVDVMGQWLTRSPELAATLTASLLAARESSDNALVRGMVIQTIGNSNLPLTESTMTAMSDAIKNESVATNRSLAAVALGSGATPENRQSVITTLEEAYKNETVLETRRHIITQIAKAARGEAPAYLQRLATPDPLLAQDVTDYVEILASANPDDWGSIWDQKSHRDNTRGTYPGGDGGHGSDGGQ